MTPNSKCEFMWPLQLVTLEINMTSHVSAIRIRVYFGLI